MSRSSATTSPKERVVILHIGFFKTGSTALQEFFELNREALAQRGIFYPERTKDDFVVPFLSWHPGFEPGGERQAYEQLVEAASGFRYTILSNENFSFLYLGEEKAAIQTIADYLARIGKVKVIIYVRRQDELMQSSYIYNVMWQGMATTQTTAFEGNPEKVIDEWALVFGPDNIIVRPYEKQQNAPDIFHDFFQAVGLPLDDDYRIPEKPANVRIPDQFVEIKRNINLLFPDKSVQHRFMAVIKELAKGLPKDEVYSAHAYLSPQRRLQVLQETAAWNASVARKYLHRSDGRLFYDPLPDPDEPWEPFGGLKAREAVSLTARVFGKFIEYEEDLSSRRIAGLQQELEARKQSGAIQAVRLEDQQRQIEHYASRIQETELQISEQQARLEAREAHIEAQAAQLQALYDSYSWKLTAPLRKIAELFQKG